MLDDVDGWFEASMFRPLTEDAEGASSRQIMSAAPCPDWLAPLLDIAAGDPVFRLHRTVWDGADRPVQFPVSMFRCDRFSYQVEALHSRPEFTRNGSLASATLRARCPRSTRR
ncbi:UTRA domain-containing protein [uncultured Enterovirga sp.]|uniref:UTRA domain-containing protein n=1 Tax=uncultured Enterovirga sp. TaxID=2026352 RepID=UPI0035CC9D08